MISTTGEYALRAIAFICQNQDRPVTSALIADETKTPQGYLSKILQSLVKADLIVSQRGLHGGFKLARPAKEISVLSILRAVDAEPQRIKHCPLGIEGHTALCPLHKLLDDSILSAEKAFAQSTMADLAMNSDGIKALCS